jgi:hypothetical protein
MLDVYMPNEDGHFVSQKQRRTAQIIAEAYPNLQLQWIPADKRSERDYAFRVVDCTPGRPPYVVCFADDCDERLLARVIQADTTRNDVQNILDAHNAAAEAVRKKEMEDGRMEAHELAFSVYRSTKIHYKHNGIDFGKPFGGRFG